MDYKVFQGRFTPHKTENRLFDDYESSTESQKLCFYACGSPAEDQEHSFYACGSPAETKNIVSTLAEALPRPRT